MNKQLILRYNGRRIFGKRFWPVSSKACPKQFCDILNVGKSFLRQTFERANQIFDTQNIFIATGTAYEELTKQQIPEIPCRIF